jgi:hypothetical protein
MIEILRADIIQIPICLILTDTFLRNLDATLAPWDSVVRLNPYVITFIVSE